jgi:hypothetical protein
MADGKAVDGSPPDVRRGSVVSQNEFVQAGLSSEDDAAVLGTTLTSSTFQHRTDILT